jgi:CMP-N-acetylneuraminic acid synthetase
VTTDDAEISDLAIRLGAEVPFVRPAELADDYTPTVPVIAHAITACHALGWQFEHVCCIYPAVPFMQSTDLVAALQRLESGSADYVFPVAAFPSAIQRALRQLTDGLMQPFNDQYAATRTQDLEPAFYDAGQFYWGRKQAWLSEKNIHRHGASLVIPSWRVVDIDNDEDWQRAELMHAVFNDANRRTQSF